MSYRSRSRSRSMSLPSSCCSPSRGPGVIQNLKSRGSGGASLHVSSRSRSRSMSLPSSCCSPGVIQNLKSRGSGGARVQLASSANNTMLYFFWTSKGSQCTRLTMVKTTACSELESMMSTKSLKWHYFGRQQVASRMAVFRRIAGGRQG